MHKPEWLSKGAELLFEKCASPQAPPRFDVLIVGSGYGGAAAAAGFAGATQGETKRPLRVCLLERGREHLPGTFPNSFSELPGEVRFSRFDQLEARGTAEGLFDLRIGEDITVLLANGLGGGSLINAGVAARPQADVFQQDCWPKKIRRASARPSWERRYDRVARKLDAQIAQVDAVGEYEAVRKYFAFEALAAKHELKKATITVDPAKCQRCGDCATGCNVGAKKTLSSTWLLDAHAQGAEIYTGATVSHLDRDGKDWVVYFSLTAQPRPLDDAPLRTVRAGHVVLAAGALGSTEILLRTRALSPALSFSRRLGERFSTNGDMISAVYGGPKRVNAAAKESQALKERQVGPTITGIVQSGGTREERIVLEELAIPGALRRVFGEVVTTSAMLASLAQRDEERHRAFSAHDREPLAVDEHAVDRCQVLAAMGDDRARGRLELVPGWQELAAPARARDGAIRVHWRNAGQEDVYRRQDKLLAELAGKRLTYLRNPLWQPIPSEVSAYFAGAKPPGLLFSVHPLGGCGMGDDAAHGVVDRIGRVFDGHGGVHDGLLVLDGSIVPCALGINPLLTIAVLAERAVAAYRRLRGWRRASPGGKKEPPRVLARPLAREAPTALRFSERASGDLRLGAVGEARRAQLDFDFCEIPDLRAFLVQARHAIGGRGALRLLDEAGNTLGRPAEVRGEVQLLVRGESTAAQRIWRAFGTYARTRGLADLVGWRRGERPRMSEARARERRPGFFERCAHEGFWLALLDACPLLRGYLTLASRVGELRHLHYELHLDSSLEDERGVRLAAGTVIHGRKTLVYEPGGNPWRQLAEMRLSLDEAGERFEMGVLTVDLGHFFRDFDTRLRIARQRDLPAAWTDLASLALFLARVILKTHFWSFRLPDYQAFDPRRDARRLPGALRGLKMERHLVGYPPRPGDEEIFLPLTRYRDDAHYHPQGPVLLIHGLGASGNLFCTTRLRVNLARHLAAQGFDVWVAELRTSIALPYSAQQWTIDEVARRDLPRIVDTVLEKTGADQLDVAAHCIGSAMFCTAVLAGWLQHPSGESKIRRAALLQVGPLVTLSQGSRLRALAVAPLRRLLPAGHLDFSVDDRAGWLESLVDRLLSTYPYPAEEARHHRLDWRIWRRRHIANCNRWAAIDGRMILHDNLSGTMLAGLGELLGHASVTTWEQTMQYALLERLTDWEGGNAYVTAGNIRRRFTFPVRFVHGEQNDVFLPLTSWRSLELLRRVNGADFRADVVVLRGYSHLDPLIGRHADSDVYPSISAFLGERPVAPVAPHAGTASHVHLRRPLIGPLLGWLRSTSAGWRVRVWCRLDDLRSPVSYALLQVCSDGKCSPITRIDPGHSISAENRLSSLVAGPLDTLLCIDVDLVGGLTGRHEIAVRSAHEALDEPVSAAHRRAEASAGFTPSRATPFAAAELLDAAAAPPRLADLAPLPPGADDDKIGEAVLSLPKPNEPLSFFVASCRYPGWLVDREMADAAFSRLADRLRALDGRAGALFLVGDQIYADATAGVFDPKDRRERFYDAYREAWTAPAAREVLSRVPTYMILDDHEAGDDWHPQDALGEDERAMRDEGLRVFARYQWLHSPGNLAQPRTRPGGVAPAYRYDFSLHGIPVFVCDTRSEREGRRSILGARQLEDLRQWLCAQERETLKIVVSPSVLVPFLEATAEPQYAARSDGWDGFPGALEALFALIAERTENVLFLCGDAHLSLSSEIWFERDGQRVGGTCYCIVASPMYAPYPFANARLEDFVPDNVERALPLGGGLRLRYRVIDGSVTDGDGFTEVMLRPAAPPVVTVHGAEPRRFDLQPGCSGGPPAAPPRRPIPALP